MSNSDLIEEAPRKRRRIDPDLQNLLNIILRQTTGKENDEDYQHSLENNLIAGKIRSIKLQNFMCHSNFEFTFEDKVNFISGKNGSGKSAILTALVIGLGGRTSDTNRGQSLKNLIQNGKHKAIVEITLSNEGFSSFKQHIYGKMIKVIRAFTPSSSTYKIVSDKGEVISNKREEIELMNLYFNIQVNNPVTILNQDTARTFFKSAVPKDLYAIFFKGTHLEEIEQRQISLHSDKIPALEKILSSKNKELIDCFKDIKEYKEKMKKMNKLHELEKQAKTLQDELYWACVSEIKNKLKNRKDIEAELLKKLPQIKEKVNKRDRLESELKEKQSHSETQLNEYKEKKRIAENKSIEVEGSLSSVVEQIGKKVHEIKHINKKVSSETNMCDSIKSEIDNHERQCEVIEKRRNNIDTKKVQLGNRLAELKAVKSTTSVHNQQLNDTVVKSAQVVDQKEQYLKNLIQKLRYKEEYLKGLSIEKNQLIVYSHWMPELVASIERAFKNKQFLVKPLGPVGSFINVKEKSWGPAIESIIGQRVLSSFCVDNNNDFKVLKSIIEKMQIPAKQKPTISISKFINQVHDVSRYETGYENYKNLLRSISISSPIIYNSLIDQLEPETILLIPTSDEAYSFMEDQNNVPLNCKRTITKKGDIFYPAPNYRSYFGSVAETTRYLQVSPAQAIKLAQSEIQSIKAEIKQVEEVLKTAKKDFSVSKQKFEESQSEVRKLNKLVENCENQLDELKKEDIPQMFSVDMLKEDLNYRQNNIKTCNKNLEVLESERKDLISKHTEIQQKIDQLKQEKEEVITEIKEVEEVIKDINNEYSKITANRDHYKNLHKTEAAKLESIRKVIKEFEIEFTKAEKEAREAHPEEIDETRDIDVLETILSKLNGNIKAMEKIIGNTDVLPNAYEHRLKLFMSSLSELDEITEVKQKLLLCLNKAEKDYKKMRSLVSSSTKNSFRRMLLIKNYKGDLFIDHDKKTLKIEMKVDRAARDGSSTETLSGGEKSYSMVSFIMSLWQNMYSPFFFLDEFDVFMDEINRDIILKLLVTYAKNRPNQQFVFLTPHSNLSQDLLRGVHFFRLPNPRKIGNKEDK